MEKHLPPTVIQKNVYTSAAFDRWTVTDRRIILSLVGEMQRQPSADNWYTVDISQMVSEAGLSSSTHSAIKRFYGRIARLSVYRKYVENGETRYRISNLVSDVDFAPGSGEVKIRPTEAAQDYFKELSNTFTVIPTIEAMGIPSFPAMRLHELLLQFQSTGWRRIPVEDLRPLLGLAQIDEQGKITSQKYRTTGELLKHVIQPAIKAIEENTSMQNIRVTQEKKGKRIVALRFSFRIVNLPKSERGATKSSPSTFSMEAQLDPILELDRLSVADQDRLRATVTETGVPFLPPQIRNNPELLEQAVREMMAAELLREHGE